MEIREIMEIMPHRYPILLVDRVRALLSEEEIETLKNVTINEPFFQGHFPGNPVMPGVLILEAAAQSAAILVYFSFPRLKDRSPAFSGMDKVRFRRLVIPGDQIVFTVKLVKRRLNIFKFTFSASVDDKVVAEGEFLANAI